MNVIELKSRLDAEQVAELQQMMFTQTGNYQVFDPFTDPVTPEQNSLTKQKLDDLKYERSEFEGKTVADLGCNLGFFSFLALNFGATNVTGYDINPMWVLPANLLRDAHVAKFPHYENKLSFEQIDFKTLPSFPRKDVLLVHSLIHWFFVFDPGIRMGEIAVWLSSQCDSVYFEGCVDATEPVMVQNKVDPARFNESLFFEEMGRFFKVKMLGRMKYNPQRVAARFYK